MKFQILSLLGILFLCGCVGSSNSGPSQIEYTDQVGFAKPIDSASIDTRPILDCIFPTDSVTTTLNEDTGNGVKHAYAIKMFFKNSNDSNIENVVVTIKTDVEKMDPTLKNHFGTTKVYPVGSIAAHSTLEQTFDWHEDSYWGGGDVKFIVSADGAKNGEECGPETGRDIVIPSS